MRWTTRAGVIVSVMWLAASAAAAGYAFAAGPSSDWPGGHDVLGPGEATVTLVIEHSRFEPSRAVVAQHTTVTFRVENRDPITHELIVGDDALHTAHEAGAHGVHGAVPGEVTVPPGSIRTTTFEFRTPGTVLFACHLPRHFAYGMVGDVVVRRP